jgi:glycosyltransferase involved in cell wall biosynthesis
LLKRLLQTIPIRKDLQVIVVDDCSPLDSYSEIGELKMLFPNVEWYSTESNGGGGKARNIGLRHAKGKYLIFADADDFFNLCFDEILDKYIGFDYDEIIFACNSLDSETYQNSNRSNNFSKIEKLWLKSHGDSESVKYQTTSPWCKFISRSLVEKNSIIFQETKVYNDVIFSQKVDFYSRSIQIDSVAIYCITDCQSSITKNNSEENTLTRLMVMLMFYSFLVERKKESARPLGTCITFELDMIKKYHNPKLRKKAYSMLKKYGVSKYQAEFSCAKYKIIKHLVMIRNAFLMMFE